MQSTENFEWQLRDLLGNGSFGYVYKGRSKTNTHTNVAIKSFRFTTKFYRNREANTLKRANHVNVVKYIAMENNLFTSEQHLIMEYCSEGDLQSFIESNQNGLSSSEFHQFFRNFLDGLKHLNENHIVHRDIKPSNILIDVNHGQRIYKLADFGAARILKPNERYGSLYGTAEYLHPDIFEHMYRTYDGRPTKQDFGELHELWSIGVTLYETVTGLLPFNPKDGRKNPKMLYKMTKEKERGQISAIETQNGNIEWSSKLPDTCALNEPLKKKITTLLAGLIESDEENMWSKAKLFFEADKRLPPLRRTFNKSGISRREARKKLSKSTHLYRREKSKYKRFQREFSLVPEN
ncbi:inhibitor of nuclear factor kappa-B kinase subunit epsilon-like isoform X1 [Contarinia nasturtii]|uniref:inhibitor of nuclear factor kappa-B kinase subunit epsilon-like isoform X1 n=1 Tax=Contarinia nasturtii TaxID=265458 RepID=UPI0012D4B90D|nr:inhibitor of nuclear factor kappa-B kinase subunit epsilon-like isoform X1 [Contarinia nasturtii]